MIIPTRNSRINYDMAGAFFMVKILILKGGTPATSDINNIAYL